MDKKIFLDKQEWVCVDNSQIHVINFAIRELLNRRIYLKYFSYVNDCIMTNHSRLIAYYPIKFPSRLFTYPFTWNHTEEGVIFWYDISQNFEDKVNNLKYSLTCKNRPNKLLLYKRVFNKI